MPKIEVELQVRDEDGDLVEEQREAVNLATDQWVTLMEALHTRAATNGLTSINLAIDDGSTNDFYVAVNSETSFFSCDDNDVGPRIAIGDGGGSSVTPTRSNYQLDNQLARKDAGTPSKGSDSVTISATFTNNTGSSYTVRETGMFQKMFSGGANRADDVLMYHDAVSATSVADGNSVTVTYSFTWP